ncbi:MAG: 4-phosphoerythronate dehydrogenase [Paludibacteraceae bacterium]
MKIIIDNHIPYIKGAFENSANVSYLSYSEMKMETLRDADALIVRTRTKCNEQLLAGSKVKFIASATIGYDHIDGTYCDNSGIKWTNAPGCNAVSVAQYMASALCFLAQKRDLDLRNMTIGIVGVGAVGSKIEQLAQSFGMQTLLNDPPRARMEGDLNFVTLKEIAEKSDIITFHTLLNRSGIDRTYHLADESFFNSLKHKPIIINASRGEVIETNALKEAMKRGKISDVVLDCWENEPEIDRELLNNVAIATPHIAGYSADGKANAAMQSVHSVSRFFNLGLDDWLPNELPDGFEGNFSEYAIADFFLKTYDIVSESNLLKSSPETFEKQRSKYPFRREPKAYRGNCPNGFEEKFDVFFR